MFLCVYSVWDEFGENGIENGFENKLLRAKTLENLDCACFNDIGLHDLVPCWHDYANPLVPGNSEFS